MQKDSVGGNPLVSQKVVSQGDSEGDTPLAHARYFNAPELFKLYSGSGASIAGPFYARRAGGEVGSFDLDQFVLPQCDAAL